MKIPSFIRTEIFDLLHSIGPDVPDLTPRRFLRHPVTQSFLKKRLGDISNPMLADLHPSLANRDHLRSYISTVQDEMFPAGTGWEGKSFWSQYCSSLLTY